MKSKRKLSKNERCPGCGGRLDSLGAIGLYVSKTSGQRFGYSLCALCSVRLGTNPERITRNVEAYFGLAGETTAQ